MYLAVPRCNETGLVETTRRFPASDGRERKQIIQAQGASRCRSRMNFVGDEKFHEHHLLVQALEPVAFSTAPVQEITNTIISAKMHHKSVASLDVDVSFITHPNACRQCPMPGQ